MKSHFFSISLCQINHITFRQFLASLLIICPEIENKLYHISSIYRFGFSTTRPDFVLQTFSSFGLSCWLLFIKFGWVDVLLIDMALSWSCLMLNLSLVGVRWPRFLTNLFLSLKIWYGHGLLFWLITILFLTQRFCSLVWICTLFLERFWAAYVFG